MSQSGELFRQTLRKQINLKHTPVRLADLIEWNRIDAVCANLPLQVWTRLTATLPRLIGGFCYLQHAFDLPDEDMVWGLGREPVVTGAAEFSGSLNDIVSLDAALLSYGCFQVPVP